MNNRRNAIGPDPRPSAAPNATERLAQRARALARPLPTEPLPSEFCEVLMFGVHSDSYAIETRWVCEVVRGMPVTTVPGNHDPLCGFINLRGEVLPVMCLPGQRPPERLRHAENWVLVLGRDRPAFGLAVSAVEDVETIPLDAILAPPKQITVGQNPLMRGVTAAARIVLQGDAVLDDPRFVIDET